MTNSIWEEAAEAVEDAINNAEGRPHPWHLEYAFKKYDLGVFRQPDRPSPDEVGWLIERNGEWWSCPYSRREYMNALDSRLTGPWTKDAAAAIRFARKVDAEKVILWEGLDAIATEHAWMDLPRAAISAATGGKP